MIVVVVWSIGLLVLCMMLYVTYKQRFSRIGRMAAKLPGPRLVFLVGNAFEFGSTSVDMFKGLINATADYGNVVRFWLGTSLYILISDLKDIEFFLIGNYNLSKSENYNFIKEGWMGDGLVTGDDAEKWRLHRKIIIPAFHMKVLEGFMEVFNKNSNILVKKLKSEVGKPGFDIEPYLSGCTLDIVCESVMGTAVNVQLDPYSEFHQAVKDATTSIVNREIRPWLHPTFLFKISPTGRLFYRSVKYFQEFVDQVIENKKKLHEESKLRTEENEKHADDNGSRKRYALLDLILQYRDAGGEAYSDTDIREEVNTFMFAGNDTVLSAVSFTLYMIAQHPDVQEEIVKELTDIFGNSDREETFQDLQNMKYLERVIKETLRVYTVGPVIGRRITQDMILPSGHTLPAGASIFLFIYGLHHNPEIYPNPEEFNPDNFLPDNVQNRLPNAYCPFGAGPRTCIGQKFAMLEIKSISSSILRKYKLFVPESGPGLVLSSEFVLRSATGTHVRIEKRI